MRPLLFAALLLAGCSGTKHLSTHKADNLDGTWVPVRQEMAGTPIPTAALQKQRLVISDTIYVLKAESVDKGGLHYGDGKMDIYGHKGANAGRHIPAIYKMNGDELTICYNLKGDGYPESFDTKGQRLHFLSVFKKAPQDNYRPASLPDR